MTTDVSTNAETESQVIYMWMEFGGWGWKRKIDGENRGICLSLFNVNTTLILTYDCKKKHYLILSQIEHIYIKSVKFDISKNILNLNTREQIVKKTSTPEKEQIILV